MVSYHSIRQIRDLSKNRNPKKLWTVMNTNSEILNANNISHLKHFFQIVYVIENVIFNL